MPNTYTTLSGLFAAIANAIRAKKGTTDTIVADNFPSEIESIASQPSLQSKTVSPSTDAQTITPDSGYDGLSQVVVNAISPTKGAQTYTPTTTDQTIDSGQWLTGVQTIKGDSNLVASNIKSGVSIFGVSGELVAPRLITTVSALQITSDGKIYLTLNSFPEDFNENWYIAGYMAVPEYSVKPFCLVINDPQKWGTGFSIGMLKYTTSSGYMATSVSYDISAKQLVFSGTTNLLSQNYSSGVVGTGSFTFWDQAVTIS